MSFWLLLAIHDGLASLGLPTLQYFMEYGFLGFAMAGLWVVFSNYLEIATEEKYRSMMEAMSDSVYICSSDFCVAYMNPSMINMIGRDATGELCHKALYDKDDAAQKMKNYSRTELAAIGKPTFPSQLDFPEF